MRDLIKENIAKITMAAIVVVGFYFTTMGDVKVLKADVISLQNSLRTLTIDVVERLARIETSLEIIKEKVK